MDFPFVGHGGLRSLPSSNLGVGVGYRVDPRSGYRPDLVPAFRAPIRGAGLTFASCRTEGELDTNSSLLAAISALCMRKRNNKENR